MQIVDLASGMIDNRVFINLPGNNKLNIRVHGDVEAAETSSADLKVTFTGWELGLGDGEGVLPCSVIHERFSHDSSRWPASKI